MTESEIMKALECCSTGLAESCLDCPLSNTCMTTSVEQLALDLINRKNAEIEKFADIGKLYSEIRADARSEAIKEFAERVKEAGAKSVEVAFYGNGTETIEFITLRTNLVDQIAKEMGVEL